MDHKSTEFQELEDYLMKSHGSTHRIRFKVSTMEHPVAMVTDRYRFKISSALSARERTSVS